MRPTLLQLLMLARHSIAAQSLIEKVAAERTSGGLIITGTIEEVPPGTKIEIEIIREAGRARKLTDRPRADAFVGPGGVFRAKVSNGDGAPLPAGTYVVKITTMFNRPWQSVEVLRKAGVEMDSQGRSDLHTNPKALRETPDFKPFDPEFPKAGRYIEVRRDVTVGVLPSDAAAIEAVKGARLLVRGAGRSSLSASTRPGSVAMYTEGTASRPPTA